MLLTDAIRHYLNALLAQGSSLSTRINAKGALGHMQRFLSHLQVHTVAQLHHDALLQWREEIAWHTTAKGTPLAARSQGELLGHLRAWCRWLVREEYLLIDPSARILNPKKPQQLPRAMLERTEIVTLLKQPDLRTLTGYRNRVILEVLYSTALRRMEIANLKVYDVEPHSGYLTVRQGKGGKDRVVPLGAQVCRLMESYLLGIRCAWVQAQKTDYLFLNRWGQRMDPNAVWAVVHKYAKLAGIKKPVSTHTLRHACATHMLRNGAPVRYLQEMLGHQSLETTQGYTQVTINDLRAAHAQFHPREQEGKLGG
jgi:integrase/recombinase XerD